jgi:hypothetical protein
MHVTPLCVLFNGTASAAVCAETKWLLCNIFGGEDRVLTRIPLHGLKNNTRNLSMTSYLWFELGTSKTRAMYAVTVRIEIHLCFMPLIHVKKSFSVVWFAVCKVVPLRPECCPSFYPESHNVYPSSGRIYTHLVEIRTHITIIFVTSWVIFLS